MAQNSFKFDPKKLVNNLLSYNEKAEIAIEIYAENGAKKMETYAKQHRRWTDRTGRARQRLTGYTTKLPNKMRIYIAHGVDYGIWLEKANEEKYAILNETVEKVGNEQILPGFAKLLERLKI